MNIELVKNYTIIRYEDLIINPDKIKKELSNLLETNIEFHSEINDRRYNFNFDLNYNVKMLNRILGYDRC